MSMIRRCAKGRVHTVGAPCHELNGAYPVSWDGERRICRGIRTLGVGVCLRRWVCSQDAAATHRAGFGRWPSCVAARPCDVLSATTRMGADPVPDAFGRGLEPPTAAPCLLSTGATFCTSQPRAFAPGICSLVGAAAPAVAATSPAWARPRPRPNQCSFCHAVQLHCGNDTRSRLRHAMLASQHLGVPP